MLNAIWALAYVTSTGMLVVTPGETVVFHLLNGRPVIDTADSPTGSDKKLTVTVMNDVPGGPPGTIMTLVNGTADWLNYKAVIDLGGRGGLSSVCTLMNNGRTSFEHWPDKLKAVAIGSFTVAPANKMTCE